MLPTRVLAREDAITLPYIPVPPQSERGRTLTTRQCRQTLNASKTHAPPARQRLQGGSTSRAQADKAFTALIAQASTLDTSSPATIVAACSQMSIHIQALISFTEKACTRMQTKITAKETALVHLIESKRALYQRKQSTKKDLENLQIKLSSFNSRLDDQKKELQVIFAEKASAKRSYQKRDLHTSVKVLTGVATLGIAPITLHQLKKKYKSRVKRSNKEIAILTDAKDALKKEIHRDKQAVSNFRSQISTLKQSIEKKDLEVKKSGAALTVLKNIRQSLVNLLSQYKFLTGDVRRVRQFSHNASLASRLQKDFLFDLKNIQKSFARIEY